MPVLKHADYLSICSFGNNCGVGVDEEPGRSIVDPLNITLPALESVGELSIGGKTARCMPIRSLSVPVKGNSVLISSSVSQRPNSPT